MLKLPPNHLIHHTYIALDDTDDLRGNVLVGVVRNWESRMPVADKGDGGVDGLEKAFGVDAGEDEATFVEGLGAFGAGADADGWERMTY